MKEIKIEHLAYMLKEAKDKNQPQPIFFLGAGASKSGKIPLASEIVSQILTDYASSPFIKDLPIKTRTYANLMNCLLPDQRDELLKKYIDDAKINVTHIYLAQLLKEDFVDYVLTVNFDNLMLRSLALFNIFPSTYDMAILKDLTTTTFKEKSVVYLHGQNHGLWLLNTPQELEKVKNIVPRIFDAIKNKRPWIFIGYSGEDPIFQHVKNLGRFNNGLYWITYNDNAPNEKVVEFLSDPNTNSFLIKGYDSDSFMLKLNSELGLEQPSIVDKPFTALKKTLNEIVDIEDKEHFRGVKERLEISLRQVEESINSYEFGIGQEEVSNINSEIDLLKKEIINLIIEKKYDANIISDIESKVNGIIDQNLQNLLSSLYSDWGSYLFELEKDNEKPETLFNQIIEKFKKSTKLNQKNYQAYYNWSTVLGSLARRKERKEAEELYNQSLDLIKKAAKIRQESNIYNNWGIVLGDLSKLKEGKEAENLLHESFKKYQKATELNPDKYEAYYYWGEALSSLAKKTDGEEAQNLYQESLKKLQKAVENGGKCYNLACWYSINNDKSNALFYLNLSLEKNEISINEVCKDDDWNHLLNDLDFKKVLNLYKVI
jgi:tetratricopeptide (TPR) repeat protein